MTAHRSTSSSLRAALAVVSRQHRKAILVFGGIVAVVVLATLLTPKTYRSEGKLLLRLGRENMALDPTAMLGSTPLLTVQQSRENEINSVIEILHSRVLLEKVVDAIGPARMLGHGENEAATPALRDEAIRQMNRALDAEAVRKSNVLAITYDASRPELAQTVVNKLVDQFLDEYIQLNRTPGGEEFLTEQTANIHKRLEGREDELRTLKDKTGLAAPDERRTIIANRIGKLEDELLETNSSLAATEAEVARLHEQLADLPEQQVAEQTVGFSNEAADGMRQQLYTLQLREKELASKVTNDHPQLQEVRQQIAQAEAVLSKEKPERTQTKTAISKTHEETQLQLLKEEPVIASLRAKSDRLTAQLNSEKASLAKLNEDELQVARLQREVQLEDANYRKYVDSLEQARIDRAMATEGKSNISIVQPGTLDMKAIKPKLLTNFALAIILGLIGGLGSAFAIDTLDETAKTADELEHDLAIPVLADIPPFAPRRAMVGNGAK